MQKYVTFVKKLAKDENYQKIKDHCYHTGKYRCAAHSICNLKLMCSRKSL